MTRRRRRVGRRPPVVSAPTPFVPSGRAHVVKNTRNGGFAPRFSPVWTNPADCIGDHRRGPRRSRGHARTDCWPTSQVLTRGSRVDRSDCRSSPHWMSAPCRCSSEEITLPGRPGPSAARGVDEQPRQNRRHGLWPNVRSVPVAVAPAVIPRVRRVGRTSGVRKQRTLFGPSFAPRRSC